MQTTQNQNNLSSPQPGAPFVAGTFGGGLYVTAEFMKEEVACQYWWMQGESGTILNPSQQAMHDKYASGYFANSKMAAYAIWSPAGMLGLGLLPGTLNNFDNDFKQLNDTADLPPLHKGVNEDNAHSHSVGIKSRLLTWPLIILIVGVIFFALGFLIVATGGLAALPALLNSFYLLFSATAFAGAVGGLVLGGLVGGTYLARAWQTASEVLTRFFKTIWLLIKIISKKDIDFNSITLSAETFKNLNITQSGWDWLDKLRIRLVADDVDPAQKAWILSGSKNNADAKAGDQDSNNIPNNNIKFFTKSRNYRLTAIIICLSLGLWGGWTIGAFLGLVILGFIGYHLGRYIGDALSSFNNQQRELHLQKFWAEESKAADQPTNNSKDAKDVKDVKSQENVSADPQSIKIDQILFERIQLLDYKIRNHNFYGHLCRKYSFLGKLRDGFVELSDNFDWRKSFIPYQFWRLHQFLDPSENNRSWYHYLLAISLMFLLFIYYALIQLPSALAASFLIWSIDIHKNLCEQEKTFSLWLKFLSFFPKLFLFILKCTTILVFPFLAVFSGKNDDYSDRPSYQKLILAIPGVFFLTNILMAIFDIIKEVFKELGGLGYTLGTSLIFGMGKLAHWIGLIIFLIANKFGKTWGKNWGNWLGDTNLQECTITIAGIECKLKSTIIQNLIRYIGDLKNHFSIIDKIGTFINNYVKQASDWKYLAYPLIVFCIIPTAIVLACYLILKPIFDLIRCLNFFSSTTYAKEKQLLQSEHKELAKQLDNYNIEKLKLDAQAKLQVMAEKITEEKDNGDGIIYSSSSASHRSAASILTPPADTIFASSLSSLSPTKSDISETETEKQKEKLAKNTTQKFARTLFAFCEEYKNIVGDCEEAGSDAKKNHEAQVGYTGHYRLFSKHERTIIKNYHKKQPEVQTNAKCDVAISTEAELEKEEAAIVAASA